MAPTRRSMDGLLPTDDPRVRFPAHIAALNADITAAGDDPRQWTLLLASETNLSEQGQQIELTMLRHGAGGLLRTWRITVAYGAGGRPAPAHVAARAADPGLWRPGAAGLKRVPLADAADQEGSHRQIDQQDDRHPDRRTGDEVLDLDRNEPAGVDHHQPLGPRDMLPVMRLTAR
jgi:hypothetical protein